MTKMIADSLFLYHSTKGVPLYEAVKDYFHDKIRSGALKPNARIPSENEIVAQFGVSRMTANRALRELATEGKIIRVHGVGSFVARPKPSSTLLEVRNIADEIRERDHAHTVRIELLEPCRANAVLQEEFGLPSGARLFHSIMVHKEDGAPIQIENRYVNPSLVPDYLDQDFTQQTANAYLTRCVAITRSDVEVEAVLPNATECQRLDIPENEPCLRLKRRTWHGDDVVTVVYALHPGSRYRLTSGRI